MSPVLPDTHALIWLLDGDRTLSSTAVAAIERAAREATVFVAAITPWEIAMLVAKGRLTLTRDVQEWVDDALRQPGIALAPLDPAIAVASTRLSGTIHGDPADRLIVATARHVGATLVTADDQLLAYGAAGHVAVLDATKQGSCGWAAPHDCEMEPATEGAWQTRGHGRASWQAARAPSVAVVCHAPSVAGPRRLPSQAPGTPLAHAPLDIVLTLAVHSMGT